MCRILSVEKADQYDKMLRFIEWIFAILLLKIVDCKMHPNCSRFEDVCSWDGNSIWNIANNEVYTTYNKARNESVLTSKSEISPGRKCFSFMYSVQDRCTPYIQVRSCTGVLLYNNSNTKKDSEWLSISVNIDLCEKSRIAISFVHGYNCCSQCNIGRFSLMEGLCQGTMNSSDVIPKVCKNITYTANTTEISKISVTNAVTVATNINSVDDSDDHDNGNTAVASNSTMLHDTSQVAVGVGTIIPLIIGCVVIVIIAWILTLRFYKRRSASRTSTECTNVRIARKTSSGVSRTTYSNQGISPSYEMTNQISDTAQYNIPAECAIVQEAFPRHSKTPYTSVSVKMGASCFAISMQENSVTNLTNTLQTESKSLISVCAEGNNAYDTNEQMPERTCSHLMEFINDTYDSTITGPKILFDVTYDHMNFKRNSDDTYNHTNLTPESEHARHDFDPTYDHI